MVEGSIGFKELQQRPEIIDGLSQIYTLIQPVGKALLANLHYPDAQNYFQTPDLYTSLGGANCSIRQEVGFEFTDTEFDRYTGGLLGFHATPRTAISIGILTHLNDKPTNPHLWVEGMSATPLMDGRERRAVLIYPKPNRASLVPVINNANTRNAIYAQVEVLRGRKSDLITAFCSSFQKLRSIISLQEKTIF